MRLYRIEARGNSTLIGLGRFHINSQRYDWNRKSFEDYERILKDISRPLYEKFLAVWNGEEVGTIQEDAFRIQVVYLEKFDSFAGVDFLNEDLAVAHLQSIIGNHPLGMREIARVIKCEKVFWEAVRRDYADKSIPIEKEYEGRAWNIAKNSYCAFHRVEGKVRLTQYATY